MYALHIERHIYRQTDCGYTWAEWFWFSKDGKDCSPLIPGNACNARGIKMAQGADILAQEKLYCTEPIKRTLKSEVEHEGIWKVGQVCIVRVE